MRVLFWSELFWPYLGGIEIQAARFIHAMQARGHQFAVVTSHAELQLPDEDEHAGARVWRLPFRSALIERNLGQLHLVRRRVAELTRAFDPDLIHLYAVGSSAMLLPSGRGKLTRPLVVTLHGEVLREPVGGRDSVLQKVLRTADWAACVSGAVLQAAHRLAPELAPRSSVVYNALDAPSLHPESLPLGEPRVLCLGRLVHDKGFDLALTAFTTLLTRFPRARLLVAGDGPMREPLARQAAEAGIGGAVDFMGWVAPDRVPELLNSVTVVVMPSRRDGMPLVAIQAAQMARPIVASRTGGLAEVIVDEQTGLLVAPEDPEGLASALSALLARPELATRMGQAARARAREIFGLERHLDAYDALYRRIVGRSTNAATGTEA
jgi:glycogen(starch) synthase